MDGNALGLLVTILDAGSLSAAARRLNMTRSNVSYRLVQLEKAAGAQLLRRTTRRIEATELGAQLYRHGVAIQESLAAARDAVASLGQGLQGRVRLSVPSGFGQMVMAPRLLAFKAAHPGVVLDVRFENRVDDLLRDEVDIAVRILADPPPSLVARALGEVRYIACASPAYSAAHEMPRTLQELSSAPVITSAVIGRELRIAGYLDGVREEAVLVPTLVSEHFPFLRDAILAGLGIGIVPDYVVAGADVVTALDHVRLSIFGTRIYMLYMRDRHQTGAARALIAHLLPRDDDCSSTA
ncbi:MAG: LysR substrate-binding domain-containing protein [Pseudomonadota bacterium]